MLYIHGFGYVWLAQDVGNVDIYVPVQLQQRVQEIIFAKYWLETLNTATRCSTYTYFKTMLNPERYLNIDLSYTCPHEKTICKI